MTEEMINLYKELNTNEKRNELSNLLIKIDQLINQELVNKNIDLNSFNSVKNYDIANQSIDKEDDMLLFFYDDIWNLKTKILALLIDNNN